MSDLEDKLNRLQDEVDVRGSIRTGLRVRMLPSEPEPTASSRVGAIAGILVLGGGLAVGAAIGADAFLNQRRRLPSRVAREEPPEEPQGVAGNGSLVVRQPPTTERDQSEAVSVGESADQPVGKLVAPP